MYALDIILNDLLLSLELENLPPNLSLQQIYINYLEYLIQHTQARLLDVTGSDLWGQYGGEAEIILTHPNLWTKGQQKFLREAAINAKLIENTRANVNLHFVKEAEAASRYYVSKYSAAFGKLNVIVFFTILSYW